MINILFKEVSPDWKKLARSCCLNEDYNFLEEIGNDLYTISKFTIFSL